MSTLRRRVRETGAASRDRRGRSRRRAGPSGRDASPRWQPGYDCAPRTDRWPRVLDLEVRRRADRSRGGGLVLHLPNLIFHEAGHVILGIFADLLDVAPYIADARTLQLVLLGGRTGAEVEGHDWEYLLTQMNLLHMDRTIGLAAHRAGLVMMAGALVWACWAVPRVTQREE